MTGFVRTGGVTGPTTPFTATFDDNSSLSDRTVLFGSSTQLDSNQYNISVIDASGASVPGTVNGMVSVEAWSPGADRPEQTENRVDLSTDARKFQLFIASIEEAVFSVDGLASGNSVVVSCFRKRA